MDAVTLGAAKKYVDETAKGLGAVKGAPCTIKSITEGENGSTIVFSWTGADGTEQTGTTFLPRGPQGEPGEKSETGEDTEARAQIAELQDEIAGLKYGEVLQLVYTPWRAEKDTPEVILRSDLECTYTIKSDTVADYDAMAPASSKCTISKGDILEVTPAADAAKWYDAYATFYISGLTVGEKYYIVLDCRNIEYDFENYINGGYYRLYKGDANATKDIEFFVSGEGLRTIPFTATAETQWLRMWCYDGSHYSAGATVTKIRDIYVNRASGYAEKTEIVNLGGSFSGEATIDEIKAGSTISATPACSVYKRKEDGDGVKKSRHDGKTLVCFGDSVTSSGNLKTDYPSVIAKETGMTVINAGFGGCRMATGGTERLVPFSMNALASAISSGDWGAQDSNIGNYTNDTKAAEHLAELKTVDWSAVDFITIAYGTNDIANSVVIDDESNPKSTATVLGALRYSLDTILTAYPHIKVLILTPIYRYWEGENIDSDEKTFSGKHFTDFVDGLLSVAKEYKIPAVDMYRTLGFNSLNRSYYFPSNDGTHPNEYGREVMGCKVAVRLLAEY